MKNPPPGQGGGGKGGDGGGDRVKKLEADVQSLTARLGESDSQAAEARREVEQLREEKDRGRERIEQLTRELETARAEGRAGN